MKPHGWRKSYDELHMRHMTLQRDHARLSELYAEQQTVIEGLVRGKGLCIISPAYYERKKN